MNDEDFAAYLLGTWTKVASSDLEQVMWDADEQALYIAFQDGSAYRYWPVDAAAAETFYRAPSKGRWRHAYFPGKADGVHVALVVAQPVVYLRRTR